MAKESTSNYNGYNGTSNKTTNLSSSNDNFEYEFGGPIGALATTLALPVVVLLLVYWSDVGYVDTDFLRNDNSIVPAGTGSSFLSSIYNSSVLCPSCAADDGRVLLFKCAACVIGWFVFQVALERTLPCELVEGAPIKGNEKNGKLKYRINGHLAFWVTLLVLFHLWPYFLTTATKNNDGPKSDNNNNISVLQFGKFPHLNLLYECYSELAFCTIILCFLLSTYLYVSSFAPRDVNGNAKILADGGNSGNVLYDYFMGRELNPRPFGSSFDWKQFCELRPGLIGWLILNVANAQQQYENLGYVSYSMILLNLFQGLYVWDALYQERAILTTMDITTDGFGFMLCFGDLAWVPFTYSIQARYLVKNDPNLSLIQLAAVLAINAFGYYIFRSANSEKDAFRRNPRDPKLSHLHFLQTKRGTKLLTCGSWWGLARKINYTGDWLIGLSWCLLCGFESVVPYYYAIYFAILLVHRSVRDDHLCQQKYGRDWQLYKELVPYRFIPGII